MLPVTTRNDILAYLTTSPDVTMEQLANEFPNVDGWTLRALRRDLRREDAFEGLATPAKDLPASTPALAKAGQTMLRAGFFRPIQIKVVAEHRPVKPVFVKAGYTVLVISDVHAPDTDLHALDVVIQIGQAMGVDGIVVNGDVFDVHALSRYTPSSEKPLRWVEEREKAVPMVASIRAAFPKHDIDVIWGNHDVRPINYISSNAPALQGLFTLPELLGVQDLGFRFPPANRIVLADNQLLIHHGTRVRGESGASVQAEVRESGMSVIMGHVHRRGLYEVTRTAQRLRGDQPLIGVELGCLCDLQPDYLERERTANWQHGAAIVTLYDDDNFDVELIRIHAGRAFFRGHEFRSRVS